MAFFIVYQIVLTITNIHALPYDGWVEHSTPTVPLSTSHGAVGYNPTTHTIWFLGGHVVTTLDEKPSSSRQLTSYNYNTNSFTDHGNNALPSAFYGWSQNYVQFGTILYFADSVNSYVNSFDMTTESFTEDDITASQAFNNEEVCFVNIRDDYLALLGASTTVQILNMQTQKWLNNVPSLLEERRGQSCIYINDKIWSIGGYASDSSSKGNVLSIEYLAATESAISDIRNQNWRYNADSLPHAIDSSRCLGINDDILLIGGYNSELQQYLDTIYTIDSFSGFVSLSGHLAKPVTGTAAVYANDMIYAFGGWTVLTDEKTNGLLLKETGYCCWAGWQTKSITTPPSDSPTNEPSTSPSKYPFQNIEAVATNATYPIWSTNYTVSILFHSCEQEDGLHACDINKTTITSQINAILIAYYDYSTKIISSDIINNEVVIILSIAMDEHSSLIGDAIANDIE
eukprot:305362_1